MRRGSFAFPAAVAAIVVAFCSGAQAPSPSAAKRAPLARVDDVEPAVDVGERRVAIAEPQIAEKPALAPQIAPAAAERREPPNAAAPSDGAKRADIAPPRAQQATPEPAAKRVLDTLDLGTTSITGNQELPKVLYIVPWKKSDLGDLVGRPVNTLLDEVLAPIDPDVFERHLKYYDSLHRQGQKE